MLQTIHGKKTYIVALGTILGAVGAYLTGEADIANTIQLVITAIFASTVRHGISNA